MKNIALLSGLAMIAVLFNSCKKDSSGGGNVSVNGWSALGNKQDLCDMTYTGTHGGGVYDTYVDNIGNLYAVGSFKNGNGEFYVAKWNGSNWSEISVPLSLANYTGIEAVTTDASGNLYVSCSYQHTETDSSTSYYYHVLKWDGSNWTNIGSSHIFDQGPTWTLAITSGVELNKLCASPDGVLYGTNNTYVFKYNGSSWDTLTMNGFPHYVNDILIDASGNMYIGGGNLQAGVEVAVWNGSGWSAMGDLNGSVTENGNDAVYSLCKDGNGNLYAAGGFLEVAGYVVKWNGSAWENLNLNGNARVNSICTDAQGNLYAGGWFNQNNKYYVAKYDGSSWSNMGLNAYAGINELGIEHGKLYAAGLLQNELNDGCYIAVHE